jgi:decaprenylphospho-beta-D-ribofuranose 2-oxidase
VVRPADADQVTDALAGATDRGAIPRGLGRSYGDAAQCAGGRVVSTERLRHIGAVGPDGAVTVGAGVDFHQLLARILPEGWFVPVSPGTRQVTVGGAVAADVHGKNHHRDGSFCRHVTSLTIATPTGVVTATPDHHADLFWATAGGMGLTGVVTEAVIRLLPVSTTWMGVDTERFADLDELMAAMVAADHRYRYSVAWIDCAAAGARLGRGVLTRGDHLGRDELPSGVAPVEVPRPPRLRVPGPAPRGLLNHASVGVFNQLWFHRAPRRRTGEVTPLAAFFHPLDGVGDWNLLYGPSGLVQYQCLVGPDATETVRALVGEIAAARMPSFLAVLKRFGPGDPGHLSFPQPGWTLALDFPVGPDGLPELLRRLDRRVLEAGGRVYLAKDARLAPESLAAMYPRLDQLVAVRRRVDPHGVLRSDLWRRLVGPEEAMR